jgi:hypothetical protein
MFLLDTDMDEIVISVSKTSESWSIRASSFTTGSCYVIEVMIGSMDVIKNTLKRETMACNQRIVEM